MTDEYVVPAGAPDLDTVQGCPPPLRDLVMRFPPDCRVRSRPGVHLGVPAPGNIGRVIWWGNTACPLPPYKCPNCDEWHTYDDDTEQVVVQAARGDLAAVCLPDQIEVVRYGDVTPDVLHDIWYRFDALVERLAPP